MLLPLHPPVVCSALVLPLPLPLPALRCLAQRQPHLLLAVFLAQPPPQLLGRVNSAVLVAWEEPVLLPLHPPVVCSALVLPLPLPLPALRCLAER